jgi:hypothetical protein
MKMMILTKVTNYLRKILLSFNFFNSLCLLVLCRVNKLSGNDSDEHIGGFTGEIDNGSYKLVNSNTKPDSRPTSSNSTNNSTNPNLTFPIKPSSSFLLLPHHQQIKVTYLYLI